MSGLYAGIDGGDGSLVVSGLNFKLGIMFDRDMTIPATIFSANSACRVL
jgi:hypothetical protein